LNGAEKFCKSVPKQDPSNKLDYSRGGEYRRRKAFADVGSIPLMTLLLPFVYRLCRLDRPFAPDSLSIGRHLLIEPLPGLVATAAYSHPVAWAEEFPETFVSNP
jgi:hypothetical protein